MGRRGPPPKPTALKRLEGTYRPDRAVQHEFIPPPGAPDAPDHIEGLALATWQRVVNEMGKCPGLLTRVDFATLEGFCVQYAEAVSSSARVRAKPQIKTPFGVKTNPAAAEARKAWALARQFANDLGLSPAGRTRVSAPPPQAEKDEAKDFLFGGPKLVKPA